MKNQEKFISKEEKKWHITVAQGHIKQQPEKRFRVKGHVFTEPGVSAEWSSLDFGQKMRIKYGMEIGFICKMMLND